MQAARRWQPERGTHHTPRTTHHAARLAWCLSTRATASCVGGRRELSTQGATARPIGGGAAGVGAASGRGSSSCWRASRRRRFGRACRVREGSPSWPGSWTAAARHKARWASRAKGSAAHSERRLELAAVAAPAHWRALLVSMQCLGAQPTRLALLDICWPPPPPDMLHLLGAFGGLRRLVVASPHFSRLERTHLAAVGRLLQLRELTRAFRTVDGTAHAPLALDPLSSLVRLTALEVRYTGLLELASAVMFCSAPALQQRQQLQQLTVALVPVPSLVGLAGLPRLGCLTLRQAQPLSSSQCASLGCCSQLSSLSLSSLQWSDLAALARLTGLRSLALQVLQPACQRGPRKGTKDSAGSDDKG